MDITTLYLNNLFLFLTLIFNLCLGIYIYFHDRKNEVNNAFSKVLFCVAIWTGAFLFFGNARSADWLLFWRRATPVGSALVAGYFFYFSLVFPKAGPKIKPLYKWLILGPGYVFSFLSLFTPFLIKDFLGRPVFGPGYNLYALYLIIFFSLSLANLFVKYIKSQGQEKLRIFYVLFGMFLSVLCGILLSLVLPIFGILKYFSLGPLFTLFLVGFVTYAIIRHRLLNIEDFLSRGLIFMAVGIAVAGTVLFSSLNKLNYLLSFYTALTNFTLALFVLFHNPKSKVNRSFTVISFSIVVWALAIFLYWQTHNPDIALMFSKMAYASTAFIPAFFVFFTLIYPREEKPISNRLAWVIFSPVVLILALDLANLIVEGVVKVDWGYNLVPGPCYFIFTVYFLSYMGWAFLNLIRQYRQYTGSIRMQAAYIFIGFLLGSVFPVITNLILPALGNTSLTHIGPSFTIILVGFIAYAILKHRLMSIEIIVQRGAVYTVTTVLILSFYALAVIVSEIYLRNIIGYSSMVVTAIAALIIAVAYQPLVAFFQSFTFRHFFKGRYDYQKTLKELSQKIASVIRLDELTRLVINSFVDIMRLSEISFMLIDRERKVFRAVASNMPRYKYVEIDCQSPIVVWLTASKDILVKEEIEDEISRQRAMGEESQERVRSLEEINDVNTKLGISVWVPIISKEELIGIIALGNKLSGDVFSIEDIGLMSTMASQVAVALENSRLYNEVVNMKDYSEEILQSMVNGVMTVDKRGFIITFNAMAEKITGRKAVEVIGKKPEEIWGKRGDIPRVIESSLADRCYINFETGIASQARGMVPVSLSSTILKDHERKKNGVLVIITDMTEVKELEDKVRRADKLTALANMAAGMAHEIKNPLSSMKVLSQLLPLKFNDEQFRNKLMEIFPREINRIDRIVENLLSFARATAPNYEKVDLKAMLEESVNYFTPKALESEIKIETHYADLPQIEMDKTQMSQVFSNLMLNAIQSMPNGGTLKVETLPGKKREDVLRSVVVRIWDTGHGISPENLKKLFDPFFTTKYGGTGLGLTITHSIVDGHKGYIDVESQVGKGTGFSVTLPITQGLV